MPVADPKDPTAGLKEGSEVLRGPCCSSGNYFGTSSCLPKSHDRDPSGPSRGRRTWGHEPNPCGLPLDTPLLGSLRGPSVTSKSFAGMRGSLWRREKFEARGTIR